MRRLDDEALMGVLRDALVPADLTPSAEEMARFSRALETSGVVARGVTTARHAEWRAHAAPRTLLAAGLVLVAGLGALSGGVATDSLPGALRSAAFDLGLPVSSPSLVAAEAASSMLADALAARDRAAVMADVPVLEQRLSALGAADRSHVEPTATALLAQAAEFLATTAPLRTPANPREDGGEGSGSSTSTPETTEPSAQSEGSPSESSSTTESSAPGDASTPQREAPPTSTTSVPAGSTATANSGGDGSSTGDSSSTSTDN